MSFYAIRYEYADESNSRQSATTAHLPLFKQEEDGQQQYHHNNFMDNAIIDPVIRQQQFQSAISCEEEMNNATVMSNARHSQHQQEQHMFSSTFNHHHHQSQQQSYWQPKQEEEEADEDNNQHGGHCWQQQQPSMIRRTNSLQTACAFQQEVGNQQQYYQSDLLSHYMGNEEDQENIAPSPGDFARKKRLQSTSSEEFDKNIIQANHRRLIKEKVEFYGTLQNEEWLPVNTEERRGQNDVVIVRRCSNEQIVDESNGGDFVDEFMESLNDSKAGNSKEQQQIAPNGFVKPAYSYSCLIGLSLKNSPSGELTVSEIYTFLCYHFPYFREAPSGWKNSVRHNLSLNKCFKKIEIETPGSHGRKSCLWTMNPARLTKMDQELKKWRERDEMRILNAMENPDDLDALQNGTMGMPPNMKPRRFSVLKMNDDKSTTLGAIRSTQKSFSASFPPSTTIQCGRDNPHPYSVARRQIPFQCHQPTFCGGIRQKPQQQNSRKTTSSQSQQGRHNESVHSQAARKLENLLKQRQKTSSIVNTDGVGGLPPATPPNAKLSRLERAEQEAAAAFLYHQLYNEEMLSNEGNKQGKSQLQIRQVSQQQCSSSHTLQLTHAQDEQLAIRIDDHHRTSPNSPSLIGGFPQSSPFATVASTSLGLESCENALTRNPLLDPTM